MALRTAASTKTSSAAAQRISGTWATRRCDPNPTLGPIEQAPFYAVTLYPGDIGSIVGLATDADARVLRDDEPIAGLFAVGNDMQSIMGGAYPGPGINLGPAIVFACAAAQAAARSARERMAQGVTDS